MPGPCSLPAAHSTRFEPCTRRQKALHGAAAQCPVRTTKYTAISTACRTSTNRGWMANRAEEQCSAQHVTSVLYTCGNEQCTLRSSLLSALPCSAQGGIIHDWLNGNEQRTMCTNETHSNFLCVHNCLPQCAPRSSEGHQSQINEWRRTIYMQ